MVHFLSSIPSIFSLAILGETKSSLRLDADSSSPAQMKLIGFYGVFQFIFSFLVSLRRCLVRHFRPCWFLIVGYLVLCFPILVKSRLCLDDFHVSGTSDLGSSVYDRQSFGVYYGPENVCSFSGSFFCFQSTLASFLPEEDLVKDSDSKSNSAAFRMSNGELVSCSLRNSASGIPFLQGFGNNSVVDRMDFCKGSFFPDLWMKDSSATRRDLDENFEEAEPRIFISSLPSPEIEISPPSLDWGTKNMYSPSLEILQVANKHNESVLKVFDLFSTNTQFKSYSFQMLTLSPGESASIPLVFLPTWLGLSSAQLVLQTSFGGFIIQAKGVATMSPYNLQPLVGFNISYGRKLSGNVSLYNPHNDMLYVREVGTWISFSDSKEINSAHVLCSANRSQQYDIQSVSSMDDKWFSLTSVELGSSRLDIRPHQQWEVPPNSSRAIIELNLLPHLGRTVFGAICLKLGNSSHEKSETAILPIDIEVHEKVSYTDSSGSISSYFDTLIPCRGRKTVFSISLRNDASYLLHVVRISEESKACNIFEIRYSKGLLLFPGTVTQIALVTYNHLLNSRDGVAENENDSSGLNCMLSIRTNDSVNPEMSIPCHDLVLNSCKYQHGFGTFESEVSDIKFISKQKDENCANTVIDSIGYADEESLQFRPKSSKVIEFDDLVLNNWKSQATMSMMSVLDDKELIFPMVQIGNHYSKWISVHNPSQKPVVMQLVLNSGTIIDHCKSTDELSEHTFSSKSSHFDSTEIRVGFSLAESAVTEAFVHPLGKALFGPVIFRPSNRCMWRSSALIRSNLSGVEWLPLEAFGGSRSLVILEGSAPTVKLDFDLLFLMTFNVSATSDTLTSVEKSASLCSNTFSKELFAKNAGELPLEVIKLKVSGTECGSDGFTIHSCKGFSLAPGESTNLLISYQTDFSASVVRRDFELSMDTGLLVIPMKASIPVHMISMCRKPFFRSSHWKLFLVVLFASFIVLHVIFRLIPQAFSPSIDEIFKLSNTAASPRKVESSSRHQRNSRNSRSLRDEEKYEAANYFNGYLDCTADRHDSTKKKLVMGCSDNQKSDSFSPQLANSHIEVGNNDRALEMPQNYSLTVRVASDKIRRRRRRPNGAKVAAKFDFSSSQSGNSTPSSPLSPNTSTPKHLLAQSPDAPVHLLGEESKEHYSSKRHSFEGSNIARNGFEVSNLVRKTESSKLSGSKLPQVTTKFPGKPSLLNSATFPGPGWHDVAAPSFLASTSPIAPCARAPGSKLCKETTVNGDEIDPVQRDFTYDIWGNHFSERIFCKPMESKSKLSDASEGGSQSQSFFTGDPQSPMMMALSRSASPGLNFSS